MRSVTSAGSARGAGFTLVEVLVAVGVLALAMPALLLALQARLDGTAHLRDETLAQWVAANRMAELRAEQAGGAALSAALEDGVEEMGGRSWRWRLRRQETPVPGFFRIDIEVGPEDSEDIVTVLTGFLAATVDAGGGDGD